MQEGIQLGLRCFLAGYTCARKTCQMHTMVMRPKLRQNLRSSHGRLSRAFVDSIQLRLECRYRICMECLLAM